MLMAEQALSGKENKQPSEAIADGYSEKALQFDLKCGSVLKYHLISQDEYWAIRNIYALTEISF